MSIQVQLYYNNRPLRQQMWLILYLTYTKLLGSYLVVRCLPGAEPLPNIDTQKTIRENKERYSDTSPNREKANLA